MKKTITVLIFLSAGFAFAFNDLDYLFQKYQIRKTIETLEALKTLYPKNSEPYLKLQETQNYFMKNMPIDAYSTYVRIKLHNIIDNKLDYIRKNERKINEKNGVLSADTDLGLILREKQLKEQERRSKEIKNNETLGGGVPAIPATPSFTPEEQMQMLKQFLKQQKGK